MKKIFRRTLGILLTTSMLVGMTACGNNSGKENNTNVNNGNKAKDTVTIAIGYQTVTAQTWGSLIIKNQKLLEKELEAEFPDVNFDIQWENATSGPPLTNNMIAGKLQFAFMGDLPILVNGEKGQTETNYDSVFIAFDGKGPSGKNQSLLVTKGGDIKSVEDLKGKEVSVPIGSSAHRMLELVLEEHGLLDDVTIVSQDVNVGLTNIEQGKIAAHATWEPFPTLAVSTGVGEILVDGSETGVDYLDGVVADRNWVNANPEYTNAFLKALIEAHEFIKNNPDETAKIFAEETGYSEEVSKAMVENITFETVIYDKDIETVRGDLDFAISVGNVTSLDLDKFIDDSYIRKAWSDLGKEYPAT